MSIGAAAGGAADALTKIIEQRRLQQMLDAEIRNREGLLAESQRSSQADEAARQRSLDIQQQQVAGIEADRAATRRDRQNLRGVQQMAGEFISQHEGPYTPEDVRGVHRLQVEMGETPNIQIPAPPKPPGTHVVDGNLVDETGKVIFTAPKTPKEPGTHVVGGALVDDRGRVLYQAPKDPSVASPYAVERATRTIESVDDLLGKVGRSTVGYGSLLSALPESDALAFKSQLDTLKANIAFNELTAMREASKTGGALGQVSNIELNLLESALGALDRAQSPVEFRNQLNKVKSSVQRWQQAAGGAAGAPPPSGGGFVDMIHPDGRALKVPAADVEQALAGGARRK